jgi:hypothetical protein
MLTVYSDSQTVLLTHFQKHGENLNFVSYCEVLWKLCKLICRKLAGKLPREVLLHHDNVGPHTARATQERIQELQWELQHSPYSPDLAHSDCHVFWSIGVGWGGPSVVNVSLMAKRLKEVSKWLRQQSKDFYAAGFNALEK